MALAFTVGSFWWLHARPGRLKVYPVVTFSGMISDGGIRLRLPILIHNPGATPQVVRALRLRAVDMDKKVFYMQAQSFHKTLDPKDSFEDFVHAFVVPGRSVATKHIGFSTDHLPHIRPGEAMSFALQVQHYDDERWRGLRTLEIHIGILTNQFIAMSNNPGHWQANKWPNGIRYQHQIMFQKVGTPYNSEDLLAADIKIAKEAIKGWG